MRKIGIIAAVLLAVGVAAVIFARRTKALQAYTVPTGADRPAIQPGTIIYTSNLAKPDRFDFICYNVQTDKGKELCIHRLCALEGDKIEMKNGEFFVNGKSADAGLSLMHLYMVEPTDLEKLQTITNEEDVIVLDNGFAMAHLADTALAKHNIKATRQLAPAGMADPNISQVFGQPWNADNFGPITVPAGKYFVLGDNRNNALDSRYRGFVDKADLVATRVK